jgi:AraC-like DNA-binding protein
MEHWEKITAVQRMEKYIEENIKEQISLYDLACEARYSPWHASRIFKDLTGKTPFQYIREMRVSKAAENMLQEKQKIIDVAFDFVFDSHEGFTRAFSKQFGLSPKEFREKRPEIKRIVPSSVQDYYRLLQKGDKTMEKEKKEQNTVFVQVVERPKRKVILKRAKKASHYFEYCEEVGCDIWDVLSEIKEALYEPIGMWLPQKFRKPGTGEYAMGVEVPLDFHGPIPDGYEITEFPECKIMVFQGPPYDDEKFEEAIGDIWEMMKRYNPELYGFKWADDDGPRFQLSPMGYRGYIEARPVRQLNK